VLGWVKLRRWNQQRFLSRSGYIIERVMKASIETLLDSFDRLPDDDKRQAAAEILKRSVAMDLPALEDDALVDAADQVFLALDREETKRA